MLVNAACLVTAEKMRDKHLKLVATECSTEASTAAQTQSHHTQKKY